MPDLDRELSDLHAALTRARALGFENTARAMEKVLETFLAKRDGLPSRKLEKTP